FQEILTEVNPPRYVRDGRIFPALDFNRSPLLFGTADRMNSEFSNHALWYADPRQGMIELRIPWGLLLMADPSNLQALGGTDERGTPGSRSTAGISISAFALRVQGSETTQGSKVLSSSLPPVRDGKDVDPPLYTWPSWNQVQYRLYFKQSYFALQKAFAELGKATSKLPDSSPTQAGTMPP
ncbi:MAG: hypothetical protein HY647_00490, partial [Acidobacteria bacterium]|nr:hypothetical protein [Acidobacteriota bacterium]